MKRGRSACLVVAALLAVNSIAPMGASADSDKLAEQATITYRLDRRNAEVDVRAAFTITNRIPSRSTSTVRTSYYIEEWGYLGVPMYAQDFAVSGRNVTKRLAKKDEAWRYYIIGFPRIFNGQRVSFTATWTLPSRGADSTNPTRVTDAYSHFCWFGQAVDTGSLSAVLPKGVEQDTSGSDVRTRTRNGAITVSAKQRSDLISFGACTDVYDTDRLVRRTLTSPAGHVVVIEGWPGDTDWLDTTEHNVGFALSTLEDVVGAPIPGDEPIVVREAAANALFGYAGDFDSDSGTIRLNERSTATVTMAHVIAHAWFASDHLAAPWLWEGLAEWAARTAVEDPCIEPASYPGKGTPKLGAWKFMGYKPSQPRIDLVDYQYEAACAIMTRVADVIGADRMRDAIGVMLDGRSPYDRLTGALPTTPTPSPSMAPDLHVGPGGTPPPTPTPVQVASVASWSPTASSTKRKKPVDWRQWLDAVDELGLARAGTVDPQIASRSLVEHGIATDKQLRGRADAQVAFHALQAMTPLGVTPAVVRRHMDDWTFGEAQADIELATAVATKLLASPLAGSDPTAAPWVAFEAAKRRQDLQRITSLVE